MTSQPRRGVILYGPPASGKDTVTGALTTLDPIFALFSRVKVGPGRSTGYRMGTPELLAQLRATAGAVVYENSRYDSTYVTDRAGLDAAVEAGVPVMHLGQVDGVRAVLDSYPADWLTVLLWCPRESTAERSAGRGDTDTSARLAAWDATQADLEAHASFRFDLVVRTDVASPEQAAERIRQALAERDQLLMLDFDDTLIDRLAAVTAWISGYCAAHGLGPDVERRILGAMQVRADLQTFEGLCAELSLPESADRLWARYSAEFPATVRPFPGVPNALEAVRASGWQVVVVTNGGGEIQRAKLKASRIDGLVDGICISEEAGTRKPDPAIFEMAAASVGRRLTGGGWMVGDNAALDVVGGRAAGLRTVWVSHGRPWPGGPKPDHIALDVLDALEHVRGGAR
ncbi:HAD-IA family hydrolase [Kitasatospora sp. NPDC028055]|uniref:HAD-IA family hydrolase n=1 Tax=Kitasatospora sp. NPDC028055 TaxID=3155653 RepID=UPI0033CF31C4